MRALQLWLRLTGYYAAVTIAAFAIARLYPGITDYMPVGGAESLLRGVGQDPFDAIEIGADNVSGLAESILWLLIASIGALLTVVPVAWTYMAIRTQDEYEQSLVETIIVLPIAVTSVVVIVHNSLALAFSLAGIVGAVRFRNTLKSSGDALFVFLATGVGLSAGTGAIEVAIVTSVMFNYTFIGLWAADFGARRGAHRYMRMANEMDDDEIDASTKPKRGKKKKNGKKPANGEPDDARGAPAAPAPAALPEIALSAPADGSGGKDP